MLISVPADRAQQVVDYCHQHGVPAATIIGEVLERGPKALVLRE